MGNFAYHLNCTVMLCIAWWSQNFRVNFAKWQQRVKPQVPLTMLPHYALKYSVKALSSTAVNFPVELCNPVQQALHPNHVN